MEKIIEQLKEKKSLLKYLRKNKDIVENLKIVFGWVENEYELAWCIKQNIYEKPICKLENCDKKANFLYYEKSYQILGYSDCCSKKHNMEYTCRKKYGENVSNPMQCNKTKNKLKQTMVDRYGVEHVSQINGIQEKISNTNIEKYGVDRPMQSENIKKILKDKNIEKYGIDNISKIPILTLLENNKDKIKPLFEMHEYKGYDVFHKWECQKCYTIFDDYLMNRVIPRCPKCYPKNKSVIETNILNYMKGYTSLNIKENYRNKENKESDIYVVDFNVAIEINGNYWHSEYACGKNSNYHLYKTISYNKENIFLLHFFEDEVLYKEKIVLSIIDAKIGKLKEKIFARKCKIKEISSKEKNKFLDENHLQGQDKSSVKLGLFHNDVLVSVMTFGKSRYNKKYQWEMHRFCNKLNHQIVGGASKLWTYFVRNHSPESVITYADRRYSDGTFYEKIGFEKIRETTPNFFVLGKNKLHRYSRLKFQKHKLKNELETFDEKKSAWENLKLNGYDRIWDCGNFVFEWKCKINTEN